MAERVGAVRAVVSSSETWDKILNSLRGKLSNETFETWFSLIELHGIDHDQTKLSLKAPNDIVRNWVTTNFSGLLDLVFSEVGLTAYSIDWIVESQVNPSVTDSSSGRQAPDEVALPTESSTPATTETNNYLNFIGPARYPDTKSLDPSLNSKYSYEGFVVGSCNQFAHAASLAVAEAPGKTYNPLYIYGGVGLGKTHLMHACGHAIKQRNPHLQLCYLSSEKFMNELINAIRYDKTPAFRERYRSVDVLLIDDVQFMAGKERTQEEFFHTFNSLYDQQKQIVISSDCPPREIPTLEERLHSRFEWGLIADIEPPDLETKVAILKEKSRNDGNYDS